MRKLTVFLFIILLGVSVFFIFNKFHQEKKAAAPAVALSRPLPKPERIGEKITYNVYLGKLYLGRAVFTHLPRVILEGKSVSLMTFETKLVNFADLEKIYSDPHSLLPLLVEREVSTWPFPEKITEKYDQENYILTITKLKGRREKKTVIRKDGVINNAILLPYYVRDKARLDIGYSLAAELPTREFSIHLVAKEEIQVPAGKFTAYHFVSSPKRFEIWLSADEERIPLKIKGAAGLRYTLSMKEYQKKLAKN